MANVSIEDASGPAVNQSALAGASPAMIRSAMIAGPLARLPNAYQNMMPKDGNLESMTYLAKEIIFKYIADMKTVAGSDWRPPTLFKAPEAVTALDKINAGLPAMRTGRRHDPINVSHLPRSLSRAAG